MRFLPRNFLDDAETYEKSERKREITAHVSSERPFAAPGDSDR